MVKKYLFIEWLMLNVTATNNGTLWLCEQFFLSVREKYTRLARLCVTRSGQESNHGKHESKKIVSPKQAKHDNGILGI